MSNKKKPLANITIDVYDGMVDNHNSGNAYYCILGLAISVTNVINGLPKDVQEETRAEFLRLLNLATTGKLYM